MEMQLKNIFYIGIEKPQEKQKQSREPIRRIRGKADTFPVSRLARPLPYAQGSLQIYSCRLPVAFGEETKKKRLRNKLRGKKWLLCLERTIAQAQEQLHGSSFDYVLVAEPLRKIPVLQNEITKNNFVEDELPEELLAVCLWEEKRRRAGTDISISLPEDCGRLAVEQMIVLLNPYLARINSVVFVGKEHTEACLLEDYLYEEYGIVMTYDKYPVSNAIWVDLTDKEDVTLAKYAKENEIYHINRTEVWKFLDTAVKNGYNTKVN